MVQTGHGALMRTSLHAMQHAPNTCTTQSQEMCKTLQKPDIILATDQHYIFCAAGDCSRESCSAVWCMQQTQAKAGQLALMHSKLTHLLQSYKNEHQTELLLRNCRKPGSPSTAPPNSITRVTVRLKDCKAQRLARTAEELEATRLILTMADMCGCAFTNPNCDRLGATSRSL